MNTSAALRLLAAANDDAVLASWAAVFDEHKMSPECDVSPYDCWEVLQGFLSSGVLSPLEYNSVDMKQAFFAGGRPTNDSIQVVLDRLKYLRSNREIKEEVYVSSTPHQFEAFTNGSGLATRSDSALSGPPRPSAALPQARVAPGGMIAMQPQQAMPARDFKAIASAPSPQMPCRSVDAKLYRGVDGEINVQLLCCNQEISLIADDEDIIDDEMIDGEEYQMHEYMFHGECKSCGSIFHNSMARSVPRATY